MKKKFSLICLSVLLSSGVIIGGEEPKKELLTSEDPAITELSASEIMNSTSTTATTTTTTTTTTTAITPTTSHNTLDESVLVTSTPTSRGFGFFRSVKDWVVASEEENLYSDLKNKTFDINNSSYHRKLGTVLEKFVVQKNDARITEMLNICRTETEYRGKIKVEDIASAQVHIFLAAQNKQKQEETRVKLEEKDKQVIQQLNANLAVLKEMVAKQIADMKHCFIGHSHEQTKTTEEQGKEIRRLKKGLGNIHKLNRDFKLAPDEYCSDEEGTDPETVNQFYNNKHILEKIKIDGKLTETEYKIHVLLDVLSDVNRNLQGIQSLTY